jgi:hypothetical protein
MAMLLPEFGIRVIKKRERNPYLYPADHVVSRIV